MPIYHPAGEDGPNAMMAQAAAERLDEDDRIEPGWPGPMAFWTLAQRERFDQTMRLLDGTPMGRPDRFVEAYRAVVLMRSRHQDAPIVPPVPKRTPTNWRRNGAVVVIRR